MTCMVSDAPTGHALSKPISTALAWWGGVECSVNRVGDRFYDQIERSGHAHRLQDLELFGQLGLSALRFPLLWERTAPHGRATADWSWSDKGLARLGQLGIRPIVGLVHHGSGPAHTSLIDPDFPQKLAEYADAVARRYPWLDAFTPINEPLTTARFSGLYGLWYPHGTDDKTFARALINQCKATLLAMQAIRAVNPAAQLVQTEDLGKTYSTEALADQAEFDNQRRWLSLDLLCGRLDANHPLWGYLVWADIGEDELAWFLAHPCPPDVIGGNYYLTSERFLDERLAHYPPAFHGSNGRQAYADVEAVRVLADGMGGIYTLLKELLLRYQRPVAITEIHNGCTREEQMRWLVDMWEGAEALRDEGVDVRAVTVWSLLGAYDWNSLLTCEDGHYEPGIFDMRGGQPRATALVRLVTNLAHGRTPLHPVLAEAGWWQRPQRLLYEPARAVQPIASHQPKFPSHRSSDARPLLILGADSPLGRVFTQLCTLRGLCYEVCLHSANDNADGNVVADAIAYHRPWAVVDVSHCPAGDEDEHEPQHYFPENMMEPTLLVSVCTCRGIQTLTFSSAVIFDRDKLRLPVNRDKGSFQNGDGDSEVAAEPEALEHPPFACGAHTGVFFLPWDEHHLGTKALQTVADSQSFVAVMENATLAPIHIPAVVHALLDLLIDGEGDFFPLRR